MIFPNSGSHGGPGQLLRPCSSFAQKRLTTRARVNSRVDSVFFHHLGAMIHNRVDKASDGEHATNNCTHLQKKDTIWKLDLPGKGHSSPVIWGGFLYLTCMNEDSSNFHVLSIHRETGNISWSREMAYQTFSKHDFNSFASPSATVDKDRVYLSWATPKHYFVAALVGMCTSSDSQLGR